MPCSCCGQCSSRPCRFVADSTGQNFVPEGSCDIGSKCSCEKDGPGDCFDESVLDEDGNVPESSFDWVFTGTCGNSCETTLRFSVQIDLGEAEADPNLTARAQEWVENVRDHLLANGWDGATEHYGPCYGPYPKHLSFVRVCCDGTAVCPATSEDCDAANVDDFAPSDTDGLQAQMDPPACGGSDPCFQVCEPNELP